MIVESMERSRPRHRRALPALARTPVGLVACGLAALLLATSNGYGYHRDELYFRMLGQHPAWGYVDQPPLTPLLGRLATAVFGDHLWALRLPATACTVATAVLVALTARELGGGRVAQTLAALGAGSAELNFGHLLLTNPVDDVVWSAVLLFVIRALTRAHELLPAQHRVGTSLPAQRSSATRIKEGPALRVGRFGGNHRGGYLSINTVGLSAANTHDSVLLEPMVDAAPPVKGPRGRPGRPRKRPLKLHCDKGYDYPRCRRALRRRGITPRIARRGIEPSQRLGRHRYVVERSLAWLVGYRRLQVRYERRADILLGFCYLACALICLKSLNIPKA